MLSENEIRARLHQGSLSLFPLGDTDVTPTGIELRLGTEFVEFPRYDVQRRPPDLDLDTSAVDRPRVRRVLLGEQLLVPPRSGLVVTSLQFVALPRDLVGILHLRSGLARLGILASLGTVSPLFQGKLTLSLFNMGEMPVVLYPGMRVALLALSEIAVSSAGLDRASEFEELIVPAEEVMPIRALLEAVADQTRSEYSPPGGIGELLGSALTAPQGEKGRRLELFATEMLRMIDGLKILTTNAQLRAEELDILVQSDLTAGFWRYLGSPLTVECKNWSGKVGAREISILGDKLRSLGPDAKTAILIAPNGITGKESDAWLKVREFRQQGKYIVVLEREHLDEISNGHHPAEMIERAFQALWLI